MTAENESTTVGLSASGGDYGNESASVDVSVTDDDTRGLVVSPTDLGVAEGRQWHVHGGAVDAADDRRDRDRVER